MVKQTNKTYKLYTLKHARFNEPRLFSVIMELFQRQRQKKWRERGRGQWSGVNKYGFPWACNADTITHQTKLNYRFNCWNAQPIWNKQKSNQQHDRVQHWQQAAKAPAHLEEVTREKAALHPQTQVGCQDVPAHTAPPCYQLPGKKVERTKL